MSLAWVPFNRPLFDRPRPVAFLVSLVLAWLLLAAAAFGLRRGAIQDDLATRATHAVAAPDVRATVHGETVTLHGRFPTAAAASAALSAARHTAGAQSSVLGDDVRIGGLPASAGLSVPLVVASDGRSLSVSAAVPDDAARHRLVSATGDAARRPRAQVGDHVTVTRGIPGPAPAAVGRLAAALGGLTGPHQVTVAGDTVTVTGAVSGSGERDRLGAAVLAAARALNPAVHLDNQLTVPGTTVPGTTVPGTTVPGTTVPGTTGPGTTVPGTTGPGTAQPGAIPSAGPATGVTVPPVAVPPVGTPAVSVPAAAPPADAGAGLARLRAAIAAGPLTFATGSAELSPAARARLDPIAAALRAATVTVLVVGHTDNSGPVALNDLLSLQRAESVTAYLASQGVDPTRMRASGVGATRPVDSDLTAAGRAGNRRVEIIPI